MTHEYLHNIKIPSYTYNKIKVAAVAAETSVEDFLIDAATREAAVLPAKVRVYYAVLIDYKTPYPDLDKGLIDQVTQLVPENVAVSFREHQKFWSPDDGEETYDPNKYLEVRLESYDPGSLLSIVEALDEMGFYVFKVSHRQAEIYPPELWSDKDKARWKKYVPHFE